MGPLLPLLMAAGPVIGKIFGGQAKGSADQRMAENAQTNAQTSNKNSLLASLYAMQQNATQNATNAGASERMNQRGQALDEKKFALAAPSVRASQSVRGSLMQNGQPVSLSGLPDRVSSRVPTISGGLSPALFNDNTRALGGEMTRKALIDQLKGDEFAPMEATDFSAGILPTPELDDYAEYQKAGLLEKILGGAGMAGDIIGGIGEASDAYKRHRAKSEPLDGELGY
jgi:hypothetical protein